MAVLLIIPFFLQALLIGFDEYHFHIKRGLPLWERIGHPLDTLSVLACLLFVIFIPYSAAALKWYIGLSAFSCLMITKDEWVHKHHCPATEQWLHACLFINHPLVLASAGLIWWIFTAKSLPLWIEESLDQPNLLYPLLIIQILGISLFLIYQIIYWNFIWKEQKKLPQ